MVTRLFDSWAHEQDVRRALGRPGGRNGPGESSALDCCVSSMPFVIGKRVAPPDGTTVYFVVTGVLGRQVPVTMSDGRAELGRGPDDPAATLSMDQEAFWRLGFGRVDAGRVLSAGQVRIEGDVTLGREGSRVDGLHDLNPARVGRGRRRPHGNRHVDQWFPGSAATSTPAGKWPPEGRYTPLFVCKRQQRPRRATRSVLPSRSTKRRWTTPSTTCSNGCRVRSGSPGSVQERCPARSSKPGWVGRRPCGARPSAKRSPGSTRGPCRRPRSTPSINRTSTSPRARSPGRCRSRRWSRSGPPWPSPATAVWSSPCRTSPSPTRS